MADAAVPQQQYVAPAAVAHVEKEQYIQHTPVWVVAVRGVQILLSIIILGMAGFLIHGHAMDANGFAVACCVFTWIVVGYLLISEKVTSARGAYNIWAVLSLDFLMALFWLASLGANAELRARFKVPVTIENCYNDGTLVSSNHCTISKRAAVADELGLALMSAVAGVSALEWLLFVATLVFHGHTFRLWHQENKKPSADNATVEMKAQGTPMLAAQATGQPAVHPQYTDQQQYQSQMYPPHEIHQQQQQPAQAYPPQQQQQQQPAYSPQTTPAPGQPYYPPQELQQQHQQQQPAPYAAYPDASQQYQQQQPQQHQAYSPQTTPAPGQPYYPPQELQHHQ